jgi:hypothetical protein
MLSLIYMITGLTDPARKLSGPAVKSLLSGSPRTLNITNFSRLQMRSASPGRVETQT